MEAQRLAFHPWRWARSESGPPTARSARPTPARRPRWCTSWATRPSGWAVRPAWPRCAPARRGAGLTVATRHRQRVGVRPGRPGSRVRCASDAERAGCWWGSGSAIRRRPATTPGRCRRCELPRRAGCGRPAAARRRPVPGGAGAQDARPVRAALARHPHLLRPGGPHQAARARLGDGPLIATELACVVDTDPAIGPGEGAELREALPGAGQLHRHLPTVSPSTSPTAARTGSSTLWSPPHRSACRGCPATSGPLGPRRSAGGL